MQQTLSRPERLASFLERHFVEDFKLVIVDEAHHAAADT
jgi:superfamily II DNA or RNA helicase